MKRLFNAFELNKYIYEHMGEEDQDSKIDLKKSDIQKLLFGALCLQYAFQPIYTYICEQELDIATFDGYDSNLNKENDIEKIFIGIKLGENECEMDCAAIKNFIDYFMKKLLYNGQKHIEKNNEKNIEKNIEKLQKILKI